MQVRAATPADVDAIRSILAEWPTETHDQVRIADVLAGARDDCELLVAEHGDDGVVGVCGLQHTDIDPVLVAPGERAVEVVTAYLRHAHRGRGIGRALLDRIEDRCRALGFTTLLVVSGSRNRESGYRFWHRRYGEPVRWDDDHFGPGAERVVWRHDLGAVSTDAMQLTCVTMDCADPRRLAAFCSAALDWPTVEVAADNSGASVHPPGGGGATYLELIRVDEPKRTKNRVHLGFTAGALGDLDAEIDRLTALGATVAWEEELPFDVAAGDRNVVLRDPEGNELCLGAGEWRDGATSTSAADRARARRGS